MGPPPTSVEHEGVLLELGDVCALHVGLYVNSMRSPARGSGLVDSPHGERDRNDDMGKLVEGVWRDVWYDTKSTGGKFVRANAKFRNWITPDGKNPPSGKAYKADAWPGVEPVEGSLLAAEGVTSAYRSAIRNSVVGRNVKIVQGASIDACVVWPGSVITRSATSKLLDRKRRTD